MKNIKHYIAASFVLFLVSSCQLFDAPDETKNVQERLINFPDILLNGDPIIVFDANKTNEAYSDPGATAAFGEENLTSEIQVTGVGDVDTNVPGVYTINYEVFATNSLDQEVSATASRRVFVVCAEEDNLSGTFTAISRNWFSGTSPETPNTAVITQTSPGLYKIPNFIYGIFRTINVNGGAEVYDVCGELEFPDQTNLSGNAFNWGGEIEVTDVGLDGQINEFILRWSVLSAAPRAEITYTRQ